MRIVSPCCMRSMRSATARLSRRRLRFRRGRKRGAICRVAEIYRLRRPDCSFEPIPRLAKALRAKAVYDASWYVESVALDSTRRHVEFNVVSPHSLSPLHTPLSGGVFERDIAASERIGIDTDTLDDYFRKYQKTLGFKRCLPENGYSRA